MREERREDRGRGEMRERGQEEWRRKGERDLE